VRSISDRTIVQRGNFLYNLAMLLIRNEFFGSGSDFSNYFGSRSGSGSCFRSCMKCVNQSPPQDRCAANSRFIPEITTRYELCRM
jgi:hypothetical protein